MKPLPRNILCYGKPEPLPERRLLRAGPLTVAFEAGGLRYVRLRDQLGHRLDDPLGDEPGDEPGDLPSGQPSEREVLRGVYVAVRDRRWGLVPGVLTRLHLEAAEDRFEIRFDCQHCRREIQFWWHGLIRGERDGTLTFHMDGAARSTFLCNRIGFCVLHPLSECVGRPCRVEHADGSIERGEFPEFISPHQPFLDMRAVSHEIEPGLWTELRFEGELFEMEDQRNWSDASFKTYCPPLRLPHPFEIRDGTKVRQAVMLRLSGGEAAPPPVLSPVAITTRLTRLEITDRPPTPLPLIGLGMSSAGQALSAGELERLRKLHLCHLRVDVTPAHTDWRETLGRAAVEAGRLGVPLEAALFLSANAAGELEEVRRVMLERASIVRWLAFDARTRLSSQAVVAGARAVLGAHDPGARFGGGADADFVSLNRNPPAAALLDFVSYSIQPQAHACDNDTLVENLAAQAETVKSARRLAPGLPIVTSPVTLRRRPETTAPPEAEAAELPPGVDARQMSLFGAGWTLGSLKCLAEAGVHAVTYYETVGWRGVMETEQGSPMPALFQSMTGSVFPLYHVLADLGEFAGGEVLPAVSSEPLRVEVLAVRRHARLRVLAANFTHRRTQVELHGLPEQLRVRPLDEENNAMEAMIDPEHFRRRLGHEEHAPGGRLQLELLPYGIVRLDSAG